jgi:hypothetical protein
MKNILFLLLPLAFACSQSEPTHKPEKRVKREVYTPTEREPLKFSFWDAEMFMTNRCSKINQTLVKKATVKWDDGTTLYAFLSVAEGGYVCISMISEHKLEILAADCGGDEKVDEWNRMIATQGL